MKTYLPTLVFCLAASTAMAQLLENPDAGKPAAANDKDKPAAGDHPAGRGPAGPGGPAGLRGPMGPPSNPMFEAIDADGDGVITKSELRRAIVQLRKLDTDKDGNITLAEVSPQGGPGGPMGRGGPFGDPGQMIDRLMQRRQERRRQVDGRRAARPDGTANDSRRRQGRRRRAEQR